MAQAFPERSDSTVNIIQHLSRFGPGIVFTLGWLALFGPVYGDFASDAWARDENAHAPFILAICAASAWLALERYTPEQVSHRERLSGAGVFAFGLLLFALGRLTDTDVFTSASQSIVAPGAVLLILGAAGLRRLWFPLLMSLYLIIWPGWLIDMATLPLKMTLASAVAEGLYAAGLPISHAGAIIAVGQYQLLVADACSGLNSLIALTAIGAVYLKLIKRGSRAVNFIVLISLVPIAVLANLCRIVLLVLLTYYGGYDLGQGFLHDGAGIFMFGVALGLVFVVDGAAASLFKRGVT